MRLRSTIGFALSLIATSWHLSPAYSQEADQDELDPALLRRIWAEDNFQPVPAAPYYLTASEHDKFKGTFGIDLSHYTFDTGNNSPSCKTEAGYTASACSCTIDWQQLIEHKIAFVYLKASDGKGIDLSFRRAWSELQPKHASKSIYRGAYHFFRPGIDADAQAETFLRATGAVDGRKTQQMPPVLDIEWSNRTVNEADFNTCPPQRRKIAGSRFYCDMWYKESATTIAAMAKKWIDKVESATGRPVIIYTNPLAWWNPIMQASGYPLMREQSVWTSRYTTAGPLYNENWGGSSKWKMPPLPYGAFYPQDQYSSPHFWQFSESGFLPSNLFMCAGRATNRRMDMNWVPVSRKEFPSLFGVAGN